MMRFQRSDKTTGMLRTILTAVLLVVVCGQTCFAEGFAPSFLPTGATSALESVFGPLFPPGGISNSFRSEWGTGISIGSTQKASFTAKDASGIQFTRDLRSASFLEQGPFRYDFYGNLRLWRFGLRGTFNVFENLSKKVHYSKVSFTGFSLRGQFDAIQTCWCSVGVMADVYFTEPLFQGSLLKKISKDDYQDQYNNIDIKGDRPSTYGVYLRYVPPEIFNMPLHFEVSGRWPLTGSKLTSYNVSLVFRPQIYRFDLAARLFYETQDLKFSQTDPGGSVGQLPVTFQNVQDAEVDMGWSFVGAEAMAFF